MGQPAILTNIQVSSIEWRNQSSTFKQQRVQVYRIPLVTDDLQGHQMKCVVVARTAIYTEMAVIQVTGVYISV